VVSFTVGYIRRLAQTVEHQQQLQLPIMYHALENDDIIYNILQHVKSSTDLVNVAMTCSTLSDPALNMLWCEQSSLGRLIMCLPQDTWEVAPDGTIVSNVCYSSLDRTMLTVLPFAGIFPRTVTNGMGARQNKRVEDTKARFQLQSKPW
jgi:hypothetical protein